MTTKEELFQTCLEEIEKRYKRLEEIFSSLSASAEAESKSTAGDKHETGRAMIQLEQEKIGKQMKDLLNQKTQLQKTDLSPSSVVRSGSVVKTDKGTFFLAAAIGKLQEFMVISPQAPLGKLLIGKTSDDKVEFNGNVYCIKEVI